MSFQILNFRKVPDTDPQEFEIHYKDLSNTKEGYTFSTASGTDEEMRAVLKEAGLNEQEIARLYNHAAA